MRGPGEWLKDWWAALNPSPRVHVKQTWKLETRDQELERRLHACEMNLQEIWDVLNARTAGHG